jgi:hypothetical protein
MSEETIAVLLDRMDEISRNLGVIDARHHISRRGLPGIRKLYPTSPKASWQESRNARRSAATSWGHWQSDRSRVG